jgi:hypothetical protein
LGAPVSLPYRWAPLGAKRVYSTEELAPGALVAWEHAVWRLIAVNSHPDDTEHPLRVILRPVAITSDDPQARDHDIHLAAQGHGFDLWHVYPGQHYPVCVICQEPMPCREQMAEKVAAAGAKDFERYTVEGFCPACQEPVSQRQQSRTWEDNAVVPGGPPVTFHMRRACWGDANRYEQRWVRLDPTHRKAVLTCAGRWIEHRDGSHECTKMIECPGRMAVHHAGERHVPGRSTCYCVAGELRG